MVKSVNTKPKNDKKKVNFKKTKKNNTAKKAAASVAKPQLEEGVDGVIEYEELGNIDSWDWTESTGTDGFITDDAGGFLCLEEISDVEVEYEGDEKTGRVAKFKRVKKKDRKAGKKATPTVPLSVEETAEFVKSSEAQDIDEEAAEAEDKIEPAEDEKTEAKQVSDKETETKQAEAKETKTPEEKPLNKRQRQALKRKAREELERSQEKQEEKTEESTKKSRPTLADVDQSVDISAWTDLKLCDNIMNALKYNQFTSPTPIQKNSLPLALAGRDIVGSAETGSGKTLAFGLPIINYISTHQHEGLAGLILTPTRELAIQVRDHIDKMSVFSDIRVVAIVGGMSIQKQERLIKSNPNIIVATPGRLWEIFSNEPTYMDMLKHIKFLVLDEADRMLEKGHFEELNQLLDALSKKRQDTTEWPEQMDDGTTKKIVPQNVGTHQTFIYTATLHKDLRFNVKAKKKKTPAKTTNTMEDLLNRIEFADKEPALVDMTSENIVAARLLEAKIDCLKTEKDVYVYYFVTRYPGRTIIFVNSIDAIRRLVPVFKLLNVEVLGLHAQMQQKQRLKSLERFKSNPKAVLVASDVAARGLDIPLVDHVVHYQLPRSGEIYVHRSGRTARANHDGVSLLLCSPEEVKIYQKLCQTLRKNQQYPDFPVDLNILREMKERVRLAVEIDSIQHQESKQNHEVNWMRNMAEEMDVEFDEETMQGKGHQKSSEQLEKDKAKAYRLKLELSELLKKPILPPNMSGKFLTGRLDSDLIDRLLKGDNNKLLPGAQTTKAVEDLHSLKKRKTTK